MIYRSTVKKVYTSNRLGLLPTAPNRKGPFEKDWTKYGKERIDVRKLKEYMEKYPNYGCCLPLGASYGIIAIDVDFDEHEDPALFAKIHKVIKKSKIWKKGKKGITAFFRYSGEVSQVFKHEFNNGEVKVAFEILSIGKTTDMPPSIHPETKEPYKYLTPLTFEDKGSLKELECLDKEDLSYLSQLCNYNKSKNCKSSTGGRNDFLKKFVTREINSGKSLDDIINDVISLDRNEHDEPLFQDDKEFANKSELEAAKTFVESINKSISESENTSSIRVRTFDEMLTMPKQQREYLVKGLLLKNGVSLLVAKPKFGKSQLSRYLMKCILDGDKFLGNEVMKGSVLSCVLEESLDNIMDYHKQLNYQNSQNLFFVEKENSQNILKDLEKTISFKKPNLVVVDTIARAFPMKDVNNYTDVSKALDWAITMSKKYRTQILLIHHARKGLNFGTDSILGSTAIHGSVDATLMIHNQQGSQELFLSSDQRYDKKMFDAHLLKRLNNGCFEVFKSLSDYNLKKMMTKILKVLNKEMCREDLFLMLKGKNELKHEALRHLLLKEKVLKRKTDGKGKTIVYFLNPDL